MDRVSSSLRSIRQHDSTATSHQFAQSPDVDVLLSESFAGTHYFHVEPSTTDRPQMVGVGFTSMLNRPDVSNIEGTLWVDRTSSELRSLEFRYTNLPPVAARTNAGGLVEFMRLSTGSWLVRYHARLRWHACTYAIRGRCGATTSW